MSEQMKDGGGKVTAKEREAAVMRVLDLAGEPLGPTEIARRIGQPWCCDGKFALSAPITPVLRRIGAVRHQGGKYAAPVAGSAA